MALQRVHTLVAVVGIAVAGSLAWWWQNRGSAPVAATAAAAPGGGAPAAGARGPGGPGGPGGPVAVEVGVVSSITLTDDVRAVGSLTSEQSVVLRPEVSGRIQRFGFDDGQRVRKGQLLVQLDDTLQQAQLKQAQAQASIARTNLQRSRELLAQGFVSQSAVDQNAASLEVAEAQVALAQAQLTRMRVVAPFDATAGIKRVNVGDYVKDGADLVNLDNLSVLAVDFSVPERFLARVKPGQPVEIEVDALPGRSFRGRVEATESQVDANGRALLVRARVDNAGALLKPGMFARPRLVFAVREGALVVPEQALVPQGQRQFVFKIVDGPGGQKVAQRVEAKLGLRLPGQVELLEGVAAGDRIVTAGQARLRGEQTPVRPVDLEAAGGGKGGPGAAPGGKAPGGAATNGAKAA